MALRVAVATGNWSNTATWNGGVLPSAGDLVASNTYTVTIDQNVNVDTITNTAQSIVNAIPVMTGYTTPSGIVSSSGDGSPHFAWQVFDNNSNTEFRFTSPGWVSYQFPSPIAIDQYTFADYNANTSWGFEGWDGTNWIRLHTVTGVSVTSYTSPLIGNSTAYTRYRLLILSSGTAQRLHTVTMFQYLGTSAATAGGSFIITGSATLTCTNSTNGINSGASTCLTVSSTSPNSVTINANVYGSQNNSAYPINKSGNCTLTFVGILDANINGALSINANCGTTNIVGTIRKTGGSIVINRVLLLSANNTCNITGNVLGNVGGVGSTKQTFGSLGSNIINITGNVDGSGLNLTNDYVMVLGTNDNVNITGNVIGATGWGNGTVNGILSQVPHYLKVVGQIIAGTGGPAIYSTSATAINIFTGPFISSTGGIMPFFVSRMHYFRTSGSYFEFRDSSTSGSLPPSSPAPATRLVAPGTVVDAPNISDVRYGTVYASGSMTGTMYVPTPSQVLNGVLVDNTVGTAALTPADVWNHALTAISASNSIGQRLKNSATVDSTGAQLQSLLNG